MAFEHTTVSEYSLVAQAPSSQALSRILLLLFHSHPEIRAWPGLFSWFYELKSNFSSRGERKEQCRRNYCVLVSCIALRAARVKECFETTCAARAEYEAACANTPYTIFFLPFPHSLSLSRSKTT